MPTYEQELVTAAHAVARLQRHRLLLRRELKRVSKELRLERARRAVLLNIQNVVDHAQLASRVYGDGVGLVARSGTDPEKIS